MKINAPNYYAGRADFSRGGRSVCSARSATRRHRRRHRQGAADVAANVYRFFDSKKAIHEGVARRLMGESRDGGAVHRRRARPGGGSGCANS